MLHLAPRTGRTPSESRASCWGGWEVNTARHARRRRPTPTPAGPISPQYDTAPTPHFQNRILQLPALAAPRFGEPISVSLRGQDCSTGCGCTATAVGRGLRPPHLFLTAFSDPSLHLPDCRHTPVVVLVSCETRAEIHPNGQKSHGAERPHVELLCRTRTPPLHTIGMVRTLYAQPLVLETFKLQG